MKKIALSILFLMCISLLVMTLPTEGVEPTKEPDTSHKGDLGNTGTTTTHYIRSRDECPKIEGKPIKYEYHCKTGGQELCSITNC
jgi:hypothetical protein